ncbi:MAG: 3-hydroxyacyl-ACP dehydratase FabZ, partial [Gammaproteobacteria bacterium]
MDILDITKYLPHRYPFLLIDKVLNFEIGKNLTAIKNVTINEPFFTGHFPGNPIMPGVLIIEALAQAAAILAYRSLKTPNKPTPLFYLGSIDKNAKLAKNVEVGPFTVIGKDVEIDEGTW